MSYRSRMRRRGAVTVGKILLVLVGGALAVWMLSAWWLMLFVGIAHRDWWPLVPTMSYHAALILSLFTTVGAGITVLFGSNRS
jgi:uncharacterized membrane protein